MCREKLTKNKVGALVVSPTRELARQIYEVAKPFVEPALGPQYGCQLLVGGTNTGDDLARIKKEGG